MSNTNRTRSIASRRSQFEQLDERVCMSVEATYDAGVLQIKGSKADDAIVIRDSGKGAISVFDVADRTRFEFSDVRSLRVQTGEGADRVQFNRHPGSASLPQLHFDLGAGDDTLQVQVQGGLRESDGPQIELDIQSGQGDDDVSVALLLPAVQKVREAAARMRVDLGAGEDRVRVNSRNVHDVDLTLDAGGGADSILIGLLLPAVQKVNAAADPREPVGPAVNLQIATGDGDDDALIGLLLPAVQKVREAAARTAVDLGAGDDRIRFNSTGIAETDLDLKAGQGDDEVLIGLLLPAVQKVREAAARMEIDLGTGHDRIRLNTLGASEVDLALAAGDGDDDVSVALLLPAVQKVREAAARVHIDLGTGQDDLQLKVRGYDLVDTNIGSDRLDSINIDVPLPNRIL